MNIDPSTMAPAERYFLMTQAVIPRPIAWVLTENEGGSWNLAPFSYFNAVDSDPPLVMISVGLKLSGDQKDTRINIERTGRFVAHIVCGEMVEVMNQTSASEAYGVSEVSLAKLETVPFEDFDMPRLAKSPVAFGCTLYQTTEIGKSKQRIILGEVRRIHLDDRVVVQDEKGRTKVDAALVDPIGRLGASEYVRLGEIVRMKRPA